MRVFADAEAVRAARGEELGTSDWLTITQEQIDQFADSTLDRQWIHVDVDRAEAGPFGAPIAHGFLTLSLLSALNAELYRFEGAKMVINYGLNKVRFPSPVRVGARVRSRTTLAEVSDTDTGLAVAFHSTIEVEGSDKPACVAEPLLRAVF